MIVVFGPIDRQAKRLVEEFGPLIRVWPKGKPPRPVPSARYAVIATKFTSHAREGAVRRWFGDRVRLVYGGDSSLRREIRLLIAG